MENDGILSEQHIRDFARDGFVVVPGLFTPEEMAAIMAWTEELAALPEVPGEYMMYFEQSLVRPGERLLSRIENFCPYHAGFNDLVQGPKLLGAVAQLFGEPAVLFKDKINFKRPGGDGFKAHQDVQAGWDAYAQLHITALVSIDAATEENGCLELVAGQHTRGLIGESWRPLEGPELEALDFMPCPTRPGDAVFFDSFVPHRSAPNLTAAERRVLYITYNRLSEGDHRARYYADKRKSYPPDCERETGKTYVFRV